MKLIKKTSPSPLIYEHMESSTGSTTISQFAKNNEVVILTRHIPSDTEREYRHPRNLSITIDMMWDFLAKYLAKAPEVKETISNLPDVSEWFADTKATEKLNDLLLKATQSEKDIFKSMVETNPALWKFKTALGLNLDINLEL